MYRTQALIQMPAPAARQNGRYVVLAMVGALIFALLLVYGLARFTLRAVPGPPTRASLSGGFIHAGWAHRLQVGQDYGLIIELHHVNGLLPRTVLQFQGLQRWVKLRNQFGDLGWNQCDSQYKPRRVVLPGGGLGFDFGVGACQVNLNLRPTRAGPHHFSIQAFVADYDARGKLRVSGKLGGAMYRWQGVVAP